MSMKEEAIRTLVEGSDVPAPFVPGESPVPVSGKVVGAREKTLMIEAALDGWLTAGRFSEQFEREFATRTSRQKAFLVNSGSSANLLAVAALCSPLLKERRLKPGDEVITVAAGFPTTVAPLVQHGLIPVFVDATSPTYNAVPEQIEAAVTPKTRAIFLAHTLANPFDVASVAAAVRKHDLWFLEDACDALGSTYTLDGRETPCGAFGHISTFSFYPAHHITMGEGGAVACDDPLLCKVLLSLRDWGRDCWCAPGHDDTCKRRYARKFATLPEGYDHKYVYSQLGYNLKISDMQAACGVAQLERLDGFIAARRKNFAQLSAALAPAEGALILPKATPGSNPAWFGFPVTLDERFNRREFCEYLNAQKIGTRLLFAGNLTRQPCFEGVTYRDPFGLDGTDKIMNQSLWVGVYPGLTEAHLTYLAEKMCSWLLR